MSILINRISTISMITREPSLPGKRINYHVSYKYPTMDTKTCHIALLQVSVDPDTRYNLSHAEQRVLQACSAGASVICLPELFSTQYFPQYIGLDGSSFSERVPGDLTRRFSSLAAANQVVLIVPFCEQGTDGKRYNSAVVIDADGTVYPPYHKVHLPQDPLFYEKGYFCPGDSYQIFDTAKGKIGVLICYDQWFPEASRSVALMGAEILFFPAAIGHIRGELPAEGNWRDAWQCIQQSHAIANSIPIAAVNRCGWEGDIFFFGGSFICDAFGRILGQAGENEEILYADLDLSYGLCIREGWGFFRNRRPDTYSRLSIPVNSGAEPISTVTPANQGYHMPAEWEPHDAVWLSWPHNHLTFPRLSEVEKTYLGIIVSLSGSEQVHLLVRDEQIQKFVSTELKKRNAEMNCIRFHTKTYSDVWIRDYGPVFLVNRGLQRISATCWEFNAWGGKYEDLIPDGQIFRSILPEMGINPFLPGIILEGGSIDVNGKGTVLTTESCLLHENRNPSLEREDIEEFLAAYLGISTVIWLKGGIAGDDTDGHIDDVARFCDSSTIVCALEEDTADENYPVLRENYRTLCDAADQDGKPFRIVPLPMPHAVSDDEYRYPASYLNFYIGNKVVLVPVFDDPRDRKALKILSSVFPTRKVVGVPARAMVEGFGTIHCATQQQPSA